MTEKVFKHPEKFDEDYLRGVVNKLWEQGNNIYLFDTMLTEDYKNKIKEVINKGNDYP